MKRLFIILTVFCFFNAPAFAEGSFTTEKIAGEPTQKVVTKVHGMVCAFCATGVKKGFSKVDSVKEVDVDMDKMLVNLTLKEGKSIDVAKIAEVVKAAGYEFKGAKYE